MLQDAIGAGLPSACEIGKMDLMELSTCAEQLGIKGCDEFETAEEYRDAIFGELEKRVQPEFRKKKKTQTVRKRGFNGSYTKIEFPSCSAVFAPSVKWSGKISFFFTV